jgi:hypothetical protein
MAAAKKKEKKPITGSASGGNITKLKQSIFCLLISMVGIQIIVYIFKAQNYYIVHLQFWFKKMISY